ERARAARPCMRLVRSRPPTSRPDLRWRTSLRSWSRRRILRRRPLLGSNQYIAAAPISAPLRLRKTVPICGSSSRATRTKSPQQSARPAAAATPATSFHSDDDDHLPELLVRLEVAVRLDDLLE